VSYVDRYNTFKSASYVYTRLYVAIVSASFLYIEWLRATMRQLANVVGQIDVRRTRGRHGIWRLRQIASPWPCCAGSTTPMTSPVWPGSDSSRPRSSPLAERPRYGALVGRW